MEVRLSEATPAGSSSLIVFLSLSASNQTRGRGYSTVSWPLNHQPLAELTSARSHVSTKGSGHGGGYFVGTFAATIGIGPSRVRFSKVACRVSTPEVPSSLALGVTDGVCGSLAAGHRYQTRHSGARRSQYPPLGVIGGW